MKHNSFELTILVNGKPVKEYGHNSKTYIEGRTGTEYSILIKNNTANRVLAIPSVDGLSTLDGERASTDSQGYVIPAYSSYIIDGWRTSLSQVAKFEFGSKKASYSNKTGHSAVDCGIVGVLIYSEKVKTQWLYKTTPWVIGQPVIIERPVVVKEYHTEWPWYQNIICSANQAATYSLNCANDGKVTSLFSDQMNSIESSPQAKCSVDEPAEFNLGTKFGQTQESSVSETTFDRDTCAGSIELYYSDKKGLLAMGVDLSKKAAIAATDKTPRAFSNFCKKP